ncbi:MAG: HxsD-like protein [Myxococcota bacterium]
MIEVRFHQGLYAGEAVDAAVSTLRAYGTLAQKEEGSYWVVAVEASTPERTLRLSRELMNYALGLTVERHVEQG